MVWAPCSPRVPHAGTHILVSPDTWTQLPLTWRGPGGSNSRAPEPGHKSRGYPSTTLVQCNATAVLVVPKIRQIRRPVDRDAHKDVPMAVRLYHPPVKLIRGRIRYRGEHEVFQDIDGAKDDLHGAADEDGCEDRGKGAEGGHLRGYRVYSFSRLNGLAVDQVSGSLAC